MRRVVLPDGDVGTAWGLQARWGPPTHRFCISSRPHTAEPLSPDLGVGQEQHSVTEDTQGLRVAVGTDGTEGWWQLPGPTLRPP